LVHTDTFHIHSEAFATKLRPPKGSLLQNDKELSEHPTCLEKDLPGNPSFNSIFRAAQGFDVLKWMFEERQGILATFVQQIAVLMEAMQTHFVRIRSEARLVSAQPFILGGIRIYIDW
jgi:hypothetical protein